MQKCKVISKYFFSDNYLKYSLKTKIYLIRRELENIEKINNKAFLQLVNNYEIGRKEKAKKLIDGLLTFPFENYLFVNKIIRRIASKVYNKIKIKQILTALSRKLNVLRIVRFVKRSKNVDPGKIKEKEHRYQPYLTDLSGKEVLLYQFEMELIRSNLIDKTNLNYASRRLRMVNRKKIDNKNLSNIKKHLEFANNNQDRIITHTEVDNGSAKVRKSLGRSKFSNKSNKKSFNSLNEYFYLKLLKKLKIKEKQFYSSQANIQRELKFLQMRIRNKKISKAKKILKLINLKNYIDIEKTKSLINTCLIKTLKHLGIYKLFCNKPIRELNLDKKQDKYADKGDEKGQ